MSGQTDGPTIYVVSGQRGSVYIRHEFDNLTAADAWAYGLEADGWTVTRSRRLPLFNTLRVAA